MEFEVREDGSATQYALRADPAFWVHVAKPMAPDLKIASALQGGLTDRAFGEALADILGRHVSDRTTGIRFTDIASSLTTDADYKQLAGQRFDFLSAVVRRWTQSVGRRMCDGYLDIHGHTFSAVFRLD